MRPRPFGRGIESRSRGSATGWRTFNEAATFRPRNQLKRIDEDLAALRPSMRPRPFGRGITHVRDRSRAYGLPSMRPRPFGRGIQPYVITDIAMRMLLQ